MSYSAKQKSWTNLKIKFSAPVRNDQSVTYHNVMYHPPLPNKYENINNELRTLTLSNLLIFFLLVKFTGLHLSEFCACLQEK